MYLRVAFDSFAVRFTFIFSEGFCILRIFLKTFIYSSDQYYHFQGNKTTEICRFWVK